MVTLYDLLEINEKASKSEIEEAYKKLALEYAMNPNVSTQENSENEMILNKLKMAYEILIDDEKRKKYDNNLAKKRAEDLIKNVPESNSKEQTYDVKNEETKKEIEAKENNISVEDRKNNITVDDRENNISNEVNIENSQEDYDNDVTLTKEEKKQVRKAAEKEFKTNLKKAQKAEEEYNQAYNEAYNNYLRKMGYQVKEPWTWKRVRNLLISIIVIIAVGALAWAIPPIRKILINIYEENFIIKSLVDIAGMIVKAILSIFK
jgi:curved DNA-binding protein CbpA